MPLVSVLIPACNAEAFLREAVDSVLGQDYPNFEVVIADDASDDGTRKVMEELAERDPRVRLVFNERRLGDAGTRNRLLDAASPDGAFVAVMDADDVCEPHRLRAQVDYLRTHPDIGLVGGHIRFIDDASAQIGERKYPLQPHEVADHRFIENPFAHPTVMMRTSVLRDVGGYDGTRQRLSDYELWMRILAKYEGANIDDYLVRYRISLAQAKSKRTRAILKATLALKLQHIDLRAVLRPQVPLRMLGELGLYCLPASLVLQLFYKRHKLI